MFGILVCGDSIAFGRGESPNTGWTGRLKKYFEIQGFHNCLFNLGMPGDTSASLLKRFETEVKSRVKYIHPGDRFVIVIAIGINDSKCTEPLHKLQTKRVLFRKNITKLIRIAKKYTKHIVVIGLTPVNEELTTPFENKYFTNKIISEYDQILRKSAGKEGVLFIDIFGKMIKKNYKKLLADGIHPNKKGYEEMYNIIRGFLVKKKVID